VKVNSFWELLVILNERTMLILLRMSEDVNVVGIVFHQIVKRFT